MDDDKVRRAPGCGGKRRYTSARVAEETAAHRRSESGHDDLEVYWCVHCSGWHIGHRRRRAGRL